MSYINVFSSYQSETPIKEMLHYQNGKEITYPV